MTRSDWIATIAAVGTLLGLIPAYRSFFSSKEQRKEISVETTKNMKPEQKSDKTAREIPMGHFEKAAGLTAIACVVFVIEIVAYSWMANLFRVKIDLGTMPLNWVVAFWLLFLFPGLCCLLAFINVFGYMGP